MADIIVAGNTSGAITISAPLVAGSGVLTLPTGTDTLVGKATTDTLTNKTLVAPALGTPASGVLTNCTGVVSGALPAGSVLQVVQGTSNTVVATTTAAYVTTGLTVSITPKFSTSKILINASLPNQNGTASTTAFFTIYRNSTNLGAGPYSAFMQSFAVGGSLYFNAPLIYLDSPATTSSTTYTIYMNAYTLQTVTAMQNNMTGVIIVQEIAA